MDFNAHPTFLHLGDTCIRVYNSFTIYLQDPNRFHPDFFTQRLCYSRPLPYPYTWYVFGNQAAIVNCNDLLRYETGLPLVPSFPVFANQQHAEQSDEPIDEVFILDDLQYEQIVNERFEQAASHHVPLSGLTEKLISKNLRVTKYCKEEEGEICVVCQVEFERRERLAVLQCKHRYHPRCITEWLVRQNVCPICKAQGISV
ncbi:hypothetical protein L2E82_20862 [Cichorium intybus]|uniref:Uncharacterized protein n=1 Tax=Cichorium intybus TaxID=13427 RepID=A0ACB9DU97_CICIN|nr:hypothetical protein L2E82_20862 [Cichorium intybus]